MNYEIPKEEVENILSVYWALLNEVESHTKPENDILNKLLVEGAYKVLDRANIHKGKAIWEK